MPVDVQSLAALLIVGFAIVYLVRGWWRTRTQSTGCGQGGSCACPSTELKRRSHP